MRRILLALVLLIGAALALPPLWFRLFREPAPELPPPGRRVELASGAGVNVVEQGAGRPVVLVHGLPGTAYDWRATSAALAARGRCALWPTTAWATAGPTRALATRSRWSRTRASCSRCSPPRTCTTPRSWAGPTAGARRSWPRSATPRASARLVLVGSAGPGIEKSGPPPGVGLLFSDPVLAWLHAVPPLAHGRARLRERAGVQRRLRSPTGGFRP